MTEATANHYLADNAAERARWAAALAPAARATRVRTVRKSLFARIVALFA